jgi:hypothetical protein
MNNVDAMLAYIERDPDNLTAVAALTDLLIEERDMTRSEADRFAERAVQAIRDARDVAAAAELLQSHQPWYAELIGDIFEQCKLPRNTVANLIVAPGCSMPNFGDPTPVPDDRFWFETTVIVGASWLLRYWRENPSLCLMANVRKQRKSRTR